MVLRKSFYIRWSAGRSPRVHEVNPGRDPSDFVFNISPCRNMNFFVAISLVLLFNFYVATEKSLS